MIFRIFCIRADHARPVLAAEHAIYKSAQEIEQDIAERVKLAKSLGDAGDKYLQGVLAMYIEDGEGHQTDRVSFTEED